MFNKLFKTEIPSWMVVLIVLMMAGGLIIGLRVFGDVRYDYRLIIPGYDGKSLSLNYGSWPALENSDFFEDVKEKFIDDKVSFVESNLSKMILRIYKEGIVVKEAPILSRGKDGSWWETPAGLYKIEGKEENHFSSFGQVYMPWSMPFQGNFFIHGWPYYPDGRPVESTYSGGCIRLSDSDAEEVFNLVDVGMPVLVFDQDFSSDNFTYPTTKPEVSAESFLAADLKNNFVLLEKNIGEVKSIASLTKLVSALVATEYINIEQEISITSNTIIETSRPRLVAGQRISVLDLLQLLLVESSNEAAEALVQYMPPDRFVELMNKKAKSVGMKSSNFVDASGVSGDDKATAEDLFGLAKYLYHNRSFILKMSAGDINRSVYGQPVFSDLDNFNGFDDDPDFVGGKVGKSSSAHETSLSVFEININGEKRPVAIIVLDSENSLADSSVIINYLRSNY